MAEESAEVRISLVADDLSDAVVKAVKQGMTELRQETEKARDAAGAGEGGMAGSLLKAHLEFEGLKAAAELVTETIHQAFELTEKLGDAAVEAAEAQEKQERAMAGNLFLMDKGAHSMRDLRDYAGETREEFAKFGMGAGVATSQIAQAYDALISRGTMGSEKAKELAEQMAVVGKVVPGGMDSLAQGFSMVELGMVRARNPVVQLIAATHTLEGNAHQVAAAMQKMSPEQQMALGEKAIAKQAEMLAKMGGLGPATLPELRTSFEGVKEGFFESMGKPMQDALVPELTRLRAFLMEHIEQIKAFGEKVGEGVAHVITYISDAIQGMYEGFQQNWGEIEKVFDDLFGEWNAAWSNARKDSGSIRTEFRVMTDDFVTLMKPILAGIKAAAEVAMDANDALHGRAVGSTQAQIAGRAAGEVVGSAAGPGDMAKVDEQIRRYRVLAAEAGTAPEAIEKYTDSLRAQAEFNMSAADKAKSAVEGGNYEGFGNYLEGAIKIQSDGAEEYAFHLLEGSEEARRALVTGAIHIGGGMDELMKIIDEKAPELAHQLKEMMGGHVGPEGIKAPQHNLNFYGSHFELKQSFANEDPERVVAVFKRELTRSVTARIESRNSTPFSL